MRFRSTSSGIIGKAQRSGRSLRQPCISLRLPDINPEERSITVCFTGHRVIAADTLPALTDRLDGVLLALYRRGYRIFISGAALGFDTLAAERVIALRQIHPDVQLVLAIPCSSQSRRWSTDQCDRYEHMVYSADKTHVLAPTYYNGCMQVRNRFMVDRSSFCLCYLAHMKGGTLSTVAYALKQDLPVLNAAMPDACAAFVQEM